jgi:hypothetical protein
MQAVDHNGDMNDYLTDEKRKIPEAHLHSICKLKQGNDTCRYIGLVPSLGFVCAKKTPMKTMLDKRASNNEMKATGDNCEGLGK